MRSYDTNWFLGLMFLVLFAVLILFLLIAAVVFLNG